MPLSRDTLIKTLLLVVLTAGLIFGFSAAPPTGYSGCFGQPNCTECHSDNPIDSGGGMFIINSAPLLCDEEPCPTLFTEGYVPNHPYTMIVTIAQAGQRRWGFEIVARFEGTEGQAGQFTVGADGFTRLTPSLGIQYVTHTASGTREGTPDGPVAFVFQWTAPSAAEIPAGNPRIVFCGVGNAANG